jgi:hypothetical protein
VIVETLETLQVSSQFQGCDLGFQKGTMASFKKGHLLAKKGLAQPRRCFHDTSKGQGDPLGMFRDKNWQRRVRPGFLTEQNFEGIKKFKKN